MRPLVLTLAALATTLAAAPAARAAPTCHDAHGETRRCGTAGAMPVGWTPPERPGIESPAGPTPMQVIGLVGAIGGLMALLALMPDFEGGPRDGWDRQEGDGEGRGQGDGA
jgi:hypothetical protein